MKRTIVSILAAAIAAGMSASVFAAYDPVAQVRDLGYAYSEDEVEDQTVDLGTVYASEGLVREIPLVYALFEGEPDNAHSSDALTSGDMDAIEVKMATVEGGDVVDAVVDRNAGMIRVLFAEEYEGGDAVPFDVTVYLIVDGERYEDLGLTFVGTVSDENAEPNDDPASKPSSPNPDTGDTSFAGVALAAMALSLAIGGAAMWRRKK